MSSIAVLHASHISNPTPPQGYGGIELIVDILARYQLNEGFKVKVLGVENPYVETVYELVSVFDHPVKRPSLRHKLSYVFKLLYETKDIDIVHLHVQWLTLATPILKARDVSTLLTLHADIKPGGAIAMFVRRFNVPLIAISYSQKERMERLGFRIYDVIYHGIEVEKYPFVKGKEDYLVYLARIDRSKGTHIAVKVAKRLSEKLVIIGPIADCIYFENHVEPFIDGENIVYLGEVDFETKIRYLSRAKALLYPVQYEEFFGIVMIEALACGTPVIGFARGSVKEVVIHGVTGFQVNDEEEMIRVVKMLDEIKVDECRRDVEERFSALTMSKRYVKVYEQLTTIS